MPRRTFKLKQVHESLNKASDFKLRNGAFKECGRYALPMISVVSRRVFLHGALSSLSLKDDRIVDILERWKINLVN